MKNLMSLSKLFLALTVIFFASSCDPDATEPVAISPNTFLESGVDLISESTTINAGTIINVRLSATAGDNEMDNLTVRQDGALLETSRYTIDGDEFNNPALLFDAERNSFVYDIAIIPHDSGTATYEFIVASALAGDEDITTLDITIAEVTTELGVTLNGENVHNSNATQELVGLNLTAVQGSSPLNTLEVLEDGVAISDLSRLRYADPIVDFDSNPFFLPEADKTGFTQSIYIRTPSSFGTYNYSIVLTDEAGASKTIDYTVNLNTPPTTLTNEFPGVPMYNNAGASPGTINLELGLNVSSINNTTSHIRDLGNDMGVWERRFEVINGAVLRQLDPNVASYSYDGIGSREALIAAWDEAGQDFSQSGTISVGSTYMVRSGAADYYVFKCASINSAGSAADQFYTFDIKQSKL